MTTPLHFLNTLKSPEFISYMGIGKSDIRIDLRQTDDVAQRFDLMINTIKNDPEVQRFSPLVTARYVLPGQDGTEEALDLETGDFSLFPLDFLEGTAPAGLNEIALSFKNSREMEKGPGDSITILSGGEKTTLRVTGIYQDVTNGGRTAKAVLADPSDEVLWYNLAVDFKAGTDIAAKRHEYSALFHPARVTDLEDYLRQTLGGTLGQVRRVTVSAVLVGLVLSILITALFMRMVIAREASSLAVMRGMGFTLRDLRIQYLLKSLLPLGVGISAGTVFSNTLGQKGVSVIWSLMGASRIEFVVDPVQAYIILPLLLWGAVSATTLSALSAVKETNIIAEISA
jgi:putative ABC transport system permease protein